MKNKIIICTVALLCSSIAFCQKKVEKQIRKTFDGYKTAILQEQGVVALNFIDSTTIAYYGQVLEHILTTDSAGISQLPMIDRYTVLMIRHTMTAKQLKTMDGKSFFVQCIINGMVGKNSVAKNEIGKISINGNEAKGQLVIDKEELPYYFEFVKETTKWKINLTSLFPLAEQAFSAMLENSGKSDPDFMQDIIQLVSGQPVNPVIWHTLLD
jgi:hypothetical protein